jgi:hypothetical protein
MRTGNNFDRFALQHSYMLITIHLSRAIDRRSLPPRKTNAVFCLDLWRTDQIANDLNRNVTVNGGIFTVAYRSISQCLRRRPTMASSRSRGQPIQTIRR